MKVVLRCKAPMPLKGFVASHLLTEVEQEIDESGQYGKEPLFDTWSTRTSIFKQLREVFPRAKLTVGTRIKDIPNEPYSLSVLHHDGYLLWMIQEDDGNVMVGYIGPRIVVAEKGFECGKDPIDEFEVVEYETSQPHLKWWE